MPYLEPVPLAGLMKFLLRFGIQNVTYIGCYWDNVCARTMDNVYVCPCCVKIFIHGFLTQGNRGFSLSLVRYLTSLPLWHSLRANALLLIFELFARFLFCFALFINRDLLL